MDEECLLIISPGFPENEADSACLPSQQLMVRALNRLMPGLRIVILAYQYPFFKNSYRWYGNEVIAMNGWKKGAVRKVISAVTIFLLLRRLHRQYKLTGILSLWCSGGAVVGNYFARLHRLRHYTWILGQDAKKENKWVSILSPRPDELIAMSSFLQSEFEKNHGIKPQYIIPNAIDPSLFEVGTGQKRDIDILGAGSLISLKRFDLLIEVVKSLIPEFPGLRACICGEGPEKEHLESMIRSAGLGANIELTGALPHGELLSLMQRSRVLLHPSSYEGFSTVCLEALYAGAHVISFCNPMKMWIRHWHIAHVPDEMIEISLEILQDSETDYRPILPFTMDKSARAILTLFS